ncbi:MAG: hypothetical protein JNK20_05440 [Flavipsychrobacter sp.]|jgi:hypothetical protein|nr:hypothetical protein [Flavipsychrobacter sp.]
MNNLLGGGFSTGFAPGGLNPGAVFASSVIGKSVCADSPLPKQQKIASRQILYFHTIFIPFMHGTYENTGFSQD